MTNRACQIFGGGLTIVGIFPLSDPPQSLRIAADRASVLVGTAVRPAQFAEAVYANTLSREFNMVEPEDAMKWWVVRHNQRTFDFGPGDEIVRFPQAHGMKVRGHCLAWSRDNPEWLAEGHFTPAELSLLLRDHITHVMKHYAGQVFAWDVVNEAWVRMVTCATRFGTTAPESDSQGTGHFISNRLFGGLTKLNRMRFCSTTRRREKGGTGSRTQLLNLMFPFP
jgi:GH35 family endo-1,4-beta-xylanase